MVSIERISLKQVLIINTGGTISSVADKQGFTPKAGVIKDALQQIPELDRPEMPNYTLVELSPLIDSSNLKIAHWQQLTKIISEHYDKVDGFVIFHGTDTMAFTASALSFMLEDLAKPVILTGSQLPLTSLRTDAKENIITSLLLASSDKLNEVAIYFDNKLLRGNRAQKVSSVKFSAFKTPNFEPLARCGTTIFWNDSLLLPEPKKPLVVHDFAEKRIASYRLFPGQDKHWLGELLSMPIDGLILQTYGSGNAPSDKKFIHTLKDATKRGIIIINTSQCQHAYVDMTTYLTGSQLIDAGVISGFDMTIETAHIKLSFLLSQHNDREKVKALLQQNLRGELTIGESL